VSKIGKYTVIRNIGSGGMGEVFLAKHPTLDHKVVIKKSTQKKSSGSKVSKHEAGSLLNLQNEYLVKILDHFVDPRDNKDCIVMQYIDGTPLHEIISSGHLQPAQALLITLQVARGLSYLHSRHIFHRDIKPGNIIIAKDGNVKIADFGICFNNSTIHELKKDIEKTSDFLKSIKKKLKDLTIQAGESASSIPKLKNALAECELKKKNTSDTITKRDITFKIAELKKEMNQEEKKAKRISKELTFLRQERKQCGSSVKKLNKELQSFYTAQHTNKTGTPAYLPPELLISGSNISHKTDLYALGVVLYMMLTGVRPYRINNYSKKAFSLKKRKPKKPSSCPRWLYKIIIACMHPKPGRRYRNADALCNDILKKIKSKDLEEHKRIVRSIFTETHISPTDTETTISQTKADKAFHIDKSRLKGPNKNQETVFSILKAAVLIFFLYLITNPIIQIDLSGERFFSILTGKSKSIALVKMKVILPEKNKKHLKNNFSYFVNNVDINAKKSALKKMAKSQRKKYILSETAGSMTENGIRKIHINRDAYIFKAYNFLLQKKGFTIIKYIIIPSGTGIFELSAGKRNMGIVKQIMPGKTAKFTISFIKTTAYPQSKIIAYYKNKPVRYTVQIYDKKGRPIPLKTVFSRKHQRKQKYYFLDIIVPRPMVSFYCIPFSGGFLKEKPKIFIHTDT
jgi:serine/threonine protein kinase